MSSSDRDPPLQPGGCALAALRDALASAVRGQRAEAWYVGGCVRDALLGRPCVDLDVVSSAPAGSLANATAATLRDALPEARIGVGRIDAERDCWRVMAPGGHLDLLRLEGPIETDLLRRDLTINAVALAVAEDEAALPLDPCGGLRDLAARTLRAVSRDNLRSDPIRLLRVARFAVELGWEVEPETTRWVAAEAGLLGGEAGERIGYELLRALGHPHGARLVDVLHSLGLADAAFPELIPLRAVPAGGYHHLDGYAHSVECLRFVDAFLRGGSDLELAHGPAERVRAHIHGEARTGVRSRPALLRLAALLHDVGKPAAMSVDAQGRVRYLGHAEAGGEIIGETARRLRLSRGERSYLQVLARQHMRNCLLGHGSPPSDRALGRFLRDLGDLAPDLCILALGDRFATRGERMDETTSSTQVAAIGRVVGLWEASCALAPKLSPLIGGRDVMEALGMPAGPEVGRILDDARAAQLAGEFRDRDDALAYLRRRGARCP